jgi:hypothetical protein
MLLVPLLEKFTLHSYLSGKRPEMLNKIYVGALQFNKPSKLDNFIMIGINAVAVG